MKPTGRKLKDWEEFVIDHGFKARNHELAAVLGKSEAEIEGVKGLGTMAAHQSGKDFGELFILWNGRPAADEEWPAPHPIRQGEHIYAWQTPEIALLAKLVGTLGPAEIAKTLTTRLVKLTGDKLAARTHEAVLLQIHRIGLATNDLVGGITTREAGRQIGSVTVVHQAIRDKQLVVERVGRHLKIPHAAWKAWKESRNFPPDGYVQLSTLKTPLSILSDKLSEFARAGYIPTAIRCNPCGSGAGSSKFGTWYISPETAKQLLADRRAGRPMPWHAKPNNDNLNVAYKLWCQRKHPEDCTTCAEIWGEGGAPKDFEDYKSKYPSLAHGAKRHLTREWDPGMTLQELASNAGVDIQVAEKAVANGMLNVTMRNGVPYVTKTEGTRWKARKCPDGENHTSWIPLSAAAQQYLFTERELQSYIQSGELDARIAPTGPNKGILTVPRHKCGTLRQKVGFSEEDAAARVGVSVAKFRLLLDGAHWRQAEGIPLATVQSVIKRLQSREGYTLEEAAEKLGETVQWVQQRILDGTVKLIAAKWEPRRTYLTEPMYQRLVAAKADPKRAKPLGDDWLKLSRAAHEAGVSTGTIANWQADGLITGKPTSSGMRYHREAIRAQARTYWENVRFHRAVPPQWLHDEKATLDSAIPAVVRSPVDRIA